MKLNFILLAIVIAFIICYFFSKKTNIQEGQISASIGSSGGLLNGYEDVLIGISDDYKLFRFDNANKEWKQIRGKSCCVIDMGYWNNTLLGVGRYDHRLYRWERSGLNGGIWKLATNLPMEWMNSIGVWKNKLLSANLQSIFRWTGVADGKNLKPFSKDNGNNPKWKSFTTKPGVKSIKEYRNQLYIVDKKGRLEMLVDPRIDSAGKLHGKWKRIGQPTEGLISICEWNDKLMGLGTDNRLYQWSNQRQNWFSKSTKFKLLSILSLTYDQFQTQFRKPVPTFNCADGFQLEPGDKKRCYRAEGEELDWWSAFNKCKDADSSKKTTLGVITSENENNFVKNLMQYPKWIGCSKQEGKWKWPDSETLEKKGYSNWNKAEKNENEFCEQYESGVWNGADKNEKKPYVCSHITSLKREFGGKGRSCTEHKDKKKNFHYWNSNKWPVNVKDKDECKNMCQNDDKCPQADYYETGKRCYLYAENGAPGARRPKITGSTPGDTYFKCNTEAFTGSMKEGFATSKVRLAARGQRCPYSQQIKTPEECGRAVLKLRNEQNMFKNGPGLMWPSGRGGYWQYGDRGAPKIPLPRGRHYNNMAQGCNVAMGSGGHNFVRFNKRRGAYVSGGYQAVCKGGTSSPPPPPSTTGKLRLANRRQSCPDSERIKTPEECGRAVLKLRDEQNMFKRGPGLRSNSVAGARDWTMRDNQHGYKGKTAHPYQWQWSHLPQGCSVYTAHPRSQNYVYFNKRKPGPVHPHFQAVCGNAGSSPPPPPTRRPQARRPQARRPQARRPPARPPPPPYKASPPSVGFKDGKNLVFNNVTIGSAKQRNAIFTLKNIAFVTKIIFEHIRGKISCNGEKGKSNWGCSSDMVGLLITDKNKRELLPNLNVKGYSKTNHKKTHWYKMAGVGKDSKKMIWELKTPQTFMPGDYHLWYGEDLTNWSESDNIGWATYKITMVVADPPPSFPISSYKNSATLVRDNAVTLKKNNLLGIINAEKNYRLEFTIIPIGKIGGLSNILHATTSDKDCCGIGDRMPSIWFLGNTTRLQIRQGNKNNGNDGLDVPKQLPLNKETTVIIELIEKYMTVQLTGAISWKGVKMMSADRPYGKAKIYLSNPWHNASQAKIKNLKWTNKTSMVLGKNSVTCSLNVAGELNGVKYKGKDLEIFGDKTNSEVVKTVNFDSDPKNPGKIIVDAYNKNDADGCKTSGFMMSCKAHSSNPWNKFVTNKSHWSATGITGSSYRNASGFPCESTAPLSVGKEGFIGFREGFNGEKKIWANSGQQTVRFEGGPRISPEVSCPTDFHGVPLKITAWGNRQGNGTESLQTVGGAFNIFNKDVPRLKGAKTIRVWPSQPKNGKWFADPIKERKVDSEGTLYLKTHMNPQWIRISNEYRECFKSAKDIFVSSGELGSGGGGEQCSGGLQYILHPKGSLCPPKTQIKTKKQCEEAVLSLGVGKLESDNYPWEKVLEAKTPAGCSWTDRSGGRGGPQVRWNAWPNSSGDPNEHLHPICYSKPPGQAAIELLEGDGCRKCPAGTYSKEGSNECIVCTKNSTNPQCKEGGKDQTSGLVCPAGTSSTGAVVTAEGEPMNLGEEQSSGNNSSETLKEQCKAFNSGAVCNPACNNTHGRCIGGICMCGGGYRGPTCDEPPKARIPTIEEWNAAFEKKKDEKEAKEEENKPDTVSYGYHEHTQMNKPFTDGLRELNKDVQELLVEARKQKEKKKKQRSFLPSEFLGWSNAIPGLLGKSFKRNGGPKPIDVGIAIDDRRKIHFRQQAKEKNTKLAPIKASPQVIKSDVKKITSGAAQDDLKGANSFKNPDTANYRGYNDDTYLKGPNKPIQKAG